MLLRMSVFICMLLPAKGKCCLENFATECKINLTKSRAYVTILLGVMKLSKNLAIKAARARLDMTQKELAQAVGVSRQTINAIEQGEYNPTINLCRAICRVLQKSLDELFWEEDPS